MSQVSQATAISLKLPNNEVSDEQILQEMDCAPLPGGVKDIVLAYAGDPTLPKTDGAFRVMWQTCAEQAPLTRLVRVIDVIAFEDTFQMRVTTLFLTAMSFTSVPSFKPGVDQLCAQCPKTIPPLGLVAPIMEKAQATADQDLITVFNEIAEQLKNEPKVAAFLTEIANLPPSEKASKISTFMQQNREFFSKITVLDLDNKKLSTLPSEIALLVNLRTLHLGGNQLKQLPESISKLENLEKLYLGGNNLTEAPEIIFKLVKLKALSLVLNPLTQQAKDALAPLEERGCTVIT